MIPSPDAMRRFVSKVQFMPCTGCVIWTGGRTSGRGHSSPYGAFWYQGRRWFAHRWAAQFIHGYDIDGLQVGHFCPAFIRPDTLCVEHVRPETGKANRELQTSQQRQYWLLVAKGYKEPPPGCEGRHDTGVPFYDEPDWLKLCHSDNAGKLQAKSRGAPWPVS